MKNSVKIRVGCALAAMAAMLGAAVPVGYGFACVRDVNEGIPFRRWFVSAYGWYCRAVGTRSCNRCVLLLGTDHAMLPTGERWPMAAAAANVAAFSEYCRSLGSRYLYVQLPKKLDVRKTMLPPGVTDVAYENADDLLGRLEDAGVATEDWRARFAGTAEQVAANFYPSDTHWNNPASLRAARELASVTVRLCEVDAPSARLADERLRPESWNAVELGRHFKFAGALARRTGRFFAKANRVTALWPKFETELAFAQPDENRQASGSFLELAVPAYAQAFFRRQGTSSFTAQYAGGGARFVRLVNHRAPIDRKVLLIGDSFSRSLRTYLWVAVREIVSVDPRQFAQPQGIARLVRDERPDLVVQIHTAAALTADVRKGIGAKRGGAAIFDYGLNRSSTGQFLR